MKVYLKRYKKYIITLEQMRSGWKYNIFHQGQASSFLEGKVKPKDKEQALLLIQEIVDKYESNR